MKISFDFDSTLAEDRIQKVAAKFISEGNEVWITTSRCLEGGISWDNKVVFRVAEKLGIPKSRIQFTNYQPKHLFLNGFDMHFDDDQIEIEDLEEADNGCLGVLINDPEFAKMQTLQSLQTMQNVNNG